MHLNKKRSLLTLVKEKEVNPVLKQNTHNLIIQNFLQIEKIPNNSKVTAI